MRNFLSIFLVICLMASFVFCLPVQAMAAEGEGTETVAPEGETQPEGETKPESTTGKVNWKAMFIKWSEEGLPAPIAAFLAAYDVFEAATVDLAKSVWRVFKFFVPMVKASF